MKGEDNVNVANNYVFIPLSHKTMSFIISTFAWVENENIPCMKYEILRDKIGPVAIKTWIANIMGVVKPIYDAVIL